MGPLEVKVDSMLEKLSLLERMEKVLHVWENSQKGSSSKGKKDKGPNSKDPNSGIIAATLERGSQGVRSIPRKETEGGPMPEESPRPPIFVYRSNFCYCYQRIIT